MFSTYYKSFEKGVHIPETDWSIVKFCWKKNNKYLILITREEHRVTC